MKHRHVILEGKPATGKTEISNLFKIYFPGRIVVLPELATILVREHGLNILEHRKELTDLLREAVPARAAEVRRLLAERDDTVLFEESHMGVHLGYCREVNDRFFLDIYEEHIKPHVVSADLFIRFEMPVPLSVQRQHARWTPDVEVSGGLVERAFGHIDRWHAEMGHDNVAIVQTDRSPDLVIAEVLDLMGVTYKPWTGR